MAFLLHSLVDINQLKKGHRVYQNCLSQLTTGVTHPSWGLPIYISVLERLVTFTGFFFLRHRVTFLWTVYCSFAYIFHLSWSGLDFYLWVAEMNATKVSSTSSKYIIITLQWLFEYLNDEYIDNVLNMMKQLIFKLQKQDCSITNDTKLFQICQSWQTHKMCIFV